MDDEPDAALARIEAALARIARARRPGVGKGGVRLPTDTAALAARLDAAIARIEEVLGPESGPAC